MTNVFLYQTACDDGPAEAPRPLQLHDEEQEEEGQRVQEPREEEEAVGGREHPKQEEETQEGVAQGTIFFKQICYFFIK